MIQWKIKKRVFKRAKVELRMEKTVAGNGWQGWQEQQWEEAKTEHFRIFNLPRDVNDQN